jgi:hypothetical protein
MKVEDTKRESVLTTPIRKKRSYKVRNVSHPRDTRQEDDEVTFTVTMNDIKSHKRERTVVDNKEPESATSSQKKSKKVKCEYWPLCKRGDDCLYWHPQQLCKHLSKCLFGDKVSSHIYLYSYNVFIVFEYSS